jgi:hypothetical protein
LDIDPRDGGKAIVILKRREESRCDSAELLLGMTVLNRSSESFILVATSTTADENGSHPESFAGRKRDLGRWRRSPSANA